MNSYRTFYIYYTTWLRISIKNSQCLEFASFVEIGASHTALFLQACISKVLHTLSTSQLTYLATILGRHSLKEFSIIVECFLHVLSNHGDVCNPWRSKHILYSGGRLVNSINYR